MEMEVDIKKIELQSQKLAHRFQLSIEQFQMKKIQAELAAKRGGAYREVPVAGIAAAAQAGRKREKSASAQQLQMWDAEAQRKAREDRIAASPLSKLSWNDVGADRLDEVDLPLESIVPMLRSERAADVGFPLKNSSLPVRSVIPAEAVNPVHENSQSAEQLLRYA